MCLLLHKELYLGWECFTLRSTEHLTVFRVYWYFLILRLSVVRRAQGKNTDPNGRSMLKITSEAARDSVQTPSQKSLDNFLGQSCQRLNANRWMQQADRIRNAEERWWDNSKSLFSTMYASICAENSVCIVKTLQYIIYMTLDSKSRCSGSIRRHRVAGHHVHADACHVFWTKAAEKPCDATWEALTATL